MMREQRMIKDLTESLGSVLDDYIINFNSSKLWYFTERRPVVNKTFRDIVEIFANYNLTTSKDILDKVYELDDDNLMGILAFMTDNYLTNGSESILNRAVLFCFALHVHCIGNSETPSVVLSKIVENDVVYIKANILTKIKFMIKKANRPYDVLASHQTLVLLSLMSGRSMNDTIKYIMNMEVDEIC